jgi:CrcB protein
MLTKLGMVALGGGLGAISRFLLSTWIHHKAGMTFPFGTLAANTIGCLAIGFLVTLSHDKLHIDTHLYGLLIIGYLGAFTTFSTFTFETWKLFESGALLHASFNILISLVACFCGLSIGIILARLLERGLPAA